MRRTTNELRVFLCLIFLCQNFKFAVTSLILEIESICNFEMDQNGRLLGGFAPVKNSISIVFTENGMCPFPGGYS